jgi:hypothetical protein
LHGLKLTVSGSVRSAVDVIVIEVIFPSTRLVVLNLASFIGWLATSTTLTLTVIVTIAITLLITIRIRLRLWVIRQTF